MTAPGSYEEDMPGGVDLEALGVDIDDVTILGGVRLIGGGMWGSNPPSVPLGAVILIPLTKDGEDMEPIAILHSADRLRQLRDQFCKVFDRAADAAEELFANDGKLTGEE